MTTAMATWRKSSHSTFSGNCAEVAAWRKSSHSTGGNCAEVGQDGTVVARDGSLSRNAAPNVGLATALPS